MDELNNRINEGANNEVFKDSIPNMKGGNCPYKPITCQEEYCKECDIYWEWLQELWR